MRKGGANGRGDMLGKFFLVLHPGAAKGGRDKKWREGWAIHMGTLGTLAHFDPSAHARTLAGAVLEA